MKLIKTNIDGCLIVESPVHNDVRGAFVKPFSDDFFRENGLNTIWQEHFWSYSKKGVIRGMHFQTPPHDHAKLVWCISGVVKDVIVDIRHGSKTYGEHITVELDSSSGNSLYIPRGMAHGFQVIQDSIVGYLVETSHNTSADSGLNYNSCQIEWDNLGIDPIVSDRDRLLQSLTEFESPFNRE